MIFLIKSSEFPFKDQDRNFLEDFRGIPRNFLLILFALGEKSTYRYSTSSMEYDLTWNKENVISTIIDSTTWGIEKKYIRFIENILTPNECQQLINLSENKGFDPALINVGGGRQKLMTDIRNNDRCIIDSPEIMEFFWQRILSVCQDQELLYGPYDQNRHAVGLNERMRILRYDPGTYFAPHYDGSYHRGNEVGVDRKDEISCITAQFYLNQDFVGGTTRFFDDCNDVDYYDVVPKTGSVILFQHDINHEGSLLIEGRKYALRTDVMYTTRGPGHEYSVEPLQFQK